METKVVSRSLATMPAHARVWVYKSAQAFSAEQEAAITDRGAAFTASWAAHGARLDACVAVLHGHFLVIAVDEQQAMASGCSIDKSVHLVRDLERSMGVVLTDRMVVIYEQDGAIRTCRVADIEGMLRNGEIIADTMIFDDTVATVGDLNARFRAPLRDTWMARYL
jgi:hypothetical protein